MKLKHKIILGFSFLLCLILLMALIARYAFNELDKKSSQILQDNYLTLQYMQELTVQMDGRTGYKFSTIDSLISLQEKNCTESGEKIVTELLRNDFNEFQSSVSVTTLHRIRDDISKINTLNMNAIRIKNEQTRAAAENSYLLIIFGFGLCLLLAVGFTVWFNAHLAKPIHKLSEGVKALTFFEKMNEAKTEFIATVSHELKTPISSIKLSSSLLADPRVGDLNPEQKALLSQIEKNTQRLLRITGELLDISQVESGKLELRIIVSELAHIIHYAIEAVESQAAQKHITIHSDFPEALMVTADPDKTTWVLVNILVNAIRYSPEDSAIHIHAAIIPGNKIAITITDSGAGIPKEYREKIFERYFKIPGKEGGTGLGLAISKEFIEAQGGAISVENNATGAVFLIILKKG